MTRRAAVNVVWVAVIATPAICLVVLYMARP